ncbi:MAG TPA: ribose 5-phosphate isomerase B, partial [bacterium]|nr:ribose 5-phosphate isomerase B [bacterium]
SDHGGYELKEALVRFLEKSAHRVEDAGCHGKDSVDYPDFGITVARAVAEGKADRGILICTTGIGMSMAANKVKGIRAALCTDVFTAKMSRLHNDANVLVLGAKVVDEGRAVEMVETWLATPFEGGRHQRRVDKINELDN